MIASLNHRSMLDYKKNATCWGHGSADHIQRIELWSTATWWRQLLDLPNEKIMVQLTVGLCWCSLAGKLNGTPSTTSWKTGAPMIKAAGLRCLKGAPAMYTKFAQQFITKFERLGFMFSINILRFIHGALPRMLCSHRVQFRTVVDQRQNWPGHHCRNPHPHGRATDHPCCWLCVRHLSAWPGWLTMNILI